MKVISPRPLFTLFGFRLLYWPDWVWLRFERDWPVPQYAIYNFRLRFGLFELCQWSKRTKEALKR